MAKMTESTCGCGSTAASDAATGKGSIERPRFFARQLVTSEDLTLGQDYFRHKMRRINRYLHGWGVVCGTRVVEAKKPWKVIVQPGYILGPYGDEIVIEREICFDVRTRCVEVDSIDACDEIVDPLCSDRTLDAREANTPWYIAVRYKEMPSRPVRVQPVGCGCDDTSCEYSRWRDGYEICVLDHCPDSHAEPPVLDKLTKPSGIPDCIPCPTDPWVVLAEVTTDAKGVVSKIDNCKCRRMLLSLAPYWWKCNEPPIVVAPPAPAPAPAPVPAPAPTGGGGTRPPIG
ncbi:hypothetical protein LJR084_003663 [Variovorax sp. LjRoot84]|uniref:hypothetical protein n=1 Tax=Variovorax sp. LjRoot84 TaxID=3342340 RepID=UPI003ECCFD66